MTSIFIVRAEYRGPLWRYASGAPESIIYGVYPTVELALGRCQDLVGEDFGYEIAWYDEVKVGPNGADCECANR